MLTVRRLAIDTYKENVAFLSRDCPLHHSEAFQALAKVNITSGERTIQATLNLVDDPAILGREQLGLSEQSFDALRAPEGSQVSVTHAVSPPSLDWVRRKISGVALPQAAFDAIISDIAKLRYSKMEIAAFLVACAGLMSMEEVLYLTRAMASAGECMTWPKKPVVDKHCIGGVPGNRTSMIVVPIVAAHGLCIPKTSSRAITSPSGTADTMEVLAEVEIDLDRMRAIVDQANGCLVWGGTAHLSPADDVLISVERPLAIDTPEQMVASILSKKIAAGSTHLVIDLPIGPSAKVRTHNDAVRLRKLFEFVGRQLDLTIDVLVSEITGPVGFGIGPVLEARDVMAVLRQDKNRPHDLEARALALAGAVLEHDPALRGGEGRARAAALLANGAALAKMEEIITLQGERKPPPLGHLVHEFKAKADGRLVSMDCWQIARGARLAGAPGAPGAGIDLLVPIGAQVRRGEAIYRLHSVLPSDFDFAKSFLQADDGLNIQS
jgi:thymidine phosphorylase